MSTSNELRAKCRNGDCQHIWTVAHLPRQQARDQIADEAGRSKALRAMFRVRKYVRVDE